MKMSANLGFVNILEPRFSDSIFSYMTRNWQPQTTLTLDKYYSPQELKEMVASSVYLDAVIESESARTGIRKEKLRKEVISYLDEMGFEKKLYVIRWMGVVFLKISFMMKINLYINEPAVLRLKAMMGHNPVLFLPTHRSYADFCLMTYLCYHYDIDFPTVAAGMDFYSMAVIGRRMRETCAFYIRRTLVGAPLYAATLKQYVRTVVAKHCAPIEFFLEGTRSRSNKSLPPKYGMLSMTLMPLFAREVPDITIVPINISYDRLMEHGLFAYEHIGVPKPKESTGGFLRALRNLNDHFGNIYINVGEPISVREYINNDTLQSNEVLKPLDMQQLTTDQFKEVQHVAEYVISQQQACTVATISNLTALVLMQSLMNNRPFTFDEVVSEVHWMIGVLRNLGAKVYENDIKSSVQRILIVHNKMMTLDKEKRLRLVAEALIEVSADMKQKMKGHTLTAVTMSTALPVIQLQLYVNPILHYVVPAAFIYLVVHSGAVEKDRVAAEYRRLRKLMRHEFFQLDNTEDNTFIASLEYCIQNKVLMSSAGQLYPGVDTKLQSLLRWSVWPALATMNTCIDVMFQKMSCDHKQALKLIQERVLTSGCHPYCLSLEAIANCLQGLTVYGALVKDKTNPEQTYNVVPEMIEECRRLVASVLPQFSVDFTRANSVILDRKTLARL